MGEGEEEEEEEEAGSRKWEAEDILLIIISCRVCALFSVAMTCGGLATLIQTEKRFHFNFFYSG